MARKDRDGARVDVSGPGEPLRDSPFRALADLRGQLPAGERDEAAPAAKGERGEATARRAVVRRERKGRGGKEVTLVERLDLPPEELDRWLADLKSQLGCGGTREGDVLVLQGDQRERLQRLLEARGVRPAKS